MSRSTPSRRQTAVQVADAAAGASVQPDSSRIPAAVSSTVQARPVAAGTRDQHLHLERAHQSAMRTHPIAGFNQAARDQPTPATKAYRLPASNQIAEAPAATEARPAAGLKPESPSHHKDIPTASPTPESPSPRHSNLSRSRPQTREPKPPQRLTDRRPQTRSPKPTPPPKPVPSPASNRRAQAATKAYQPPAPHQRAHAPPPTPASKSRRAPGRRAPPAQGSCRQHRRRCPRKSGQR
jgi:hypothetical protein